MYGQWLMLHVPFRQSMDFIDEELLSKVPPGHRCFTAALYCHHPIAVSMWTNEAAIEHELMIEGHTKKHSESILGMVGATRSLVHDYVSGHLNVHAEALYEDARAAEAPGQFLDLVLNTEQ